jgi:SAM-dependent methyltransferase
MPSLPPHSAHLVETVMPNQSVAPSPTRFFNAANAYQTTAALKAAVELDVFTALGQGITSISDLATQCGASERGLRILCDYLVVSGFLTKDEGRYSLTPDSATFLNRRSPAYMGGALEFLLSPQLMEGFSHLTDAVRQGGTALPESGTLAPEHPVWVQFAQAMAPMMAMPAQLLAQLVDPDAKQPLKVLDIAASHGLFGISFAQHNPQAYVVGLDWENVLQVAHANAHTAGVSDRYRMLPGSAFEVDYGKDYDVILLPNFLHHFDIPTCEKLLTKVYAALVPGGRAVTFEFIPDENRVSPPEAAAFSLTMLGTTPSGDAYTFAEYERMFSNVGFSRNELHALPPAVQQVVISYKGN